MIWNLKHAINTDIFKTKQYDRLQGQYVNQQRRISKYFDQYAWMIWNFKHGKDTHIFKTEQVSFQTQLIYIST